MLTSRTLGVLGLFVVSVTGAEPPSAVHPIVEAQTGMLLGGATASGKWVKPEVVAKSWKAGGALRLFTLAKPEGEAKGAAAKAEGDPCPDVLFVSLQPKPEHPAIATSAPWKVLPRVPRVADPTQEVYVKATREFLLARGLAKPEVKIHQIIRIDLEGDGEEEVLIAATNYEKDGDGMINSAKANSYSCVFLRRVVKGKVSTQLVAGEFYPTKKKFNAPNEYSVGAVLDLNGDGKMEVVVRSAYYEGEEISVYQCAEGKIMRVLSVGCGA